MESVRRVGPTPAGAVAFVRPRGQTMRHRDRSDLELELAHARFVAVPALLWVAAIVFAVGTALWERTAVAPDESAAVAPPAARSSRAGTGPPEAL